MRSSSPSQHRTNLFGMPHDELLQALDQWGISNAQVNALLRCIYREGVSDFLQMEGLSKSLKQNLSDHYACAIPGQAQRILSSDGTSKYLFCFADNTRIDTVLIPSAERRTLCISSQAGCALGCTFCATGKGGFERNLSAAEIIAQIWHVERDLQNDGERVSNVVMMGMGEPLLNFPALIKALSLLRDAYAFDLPRRRVTVSTAGYIPRIAELAQHADVTLAVSLHAANDDLRSRLVPINKKYKLADLLQACRDYAQASDSKTITFEYVMLQGVNDSEADAKALACLLKDFPAKLNLIPFNDFEDSDFTASSPAVIERFRQQLFGAGLVATVRRPRGSDIGAACGQLTSSPLVGGTPCELLE